MDNKNIKSVELKIEIDKQNINSHFFVPQNQKQNLILQNIKSFNLWEMQVDTKYNFYMTISIFVYPISFEYTNKHGHQNILRTHLEYSNMS